MRYSIPILVAAVLLGAAPCAAQASQAEQDANHARYAAARRTAAGRADTLTVEVSNLSSDDGDLRLGLYDPRTKFPRELDHVDNIVVRIVNGRAVGRFVNVPYGSYAIAAFHDKNRDGRLNKGLFGRPTEPIAFSSGARVRGFRPPAFADATFAVNAPAARTTLTF